MNRRSRKLLNKRRRSRRRRSRQKPKYPVVKCSLTMKSGSPQVFYTSSSCPKFEKGHGKVPSPKMNWSQSSKRVVIVGAGIAGLVCAYELTKAGMDSIEIYESAPHAGGKMTGFEIEDLHFPVEHSTRVYGPGYVALLDVFSRIPSVNGGSVIDNLRPMSSLLIMPDLKSSFEMYSATDFVKAMKEYGLSLSEMMNFVRKMQHWKKMSAKERVQSAWGISFSSYFGYRNMSAAYRSFISAFVGILVAARPSSNAWSIMEMLFDMMYDSKVMPEVKDRLASRFLAADGPTSSVIIEPIVRYLEKSGVKIHLNSRVDSLIVDKGKIRGVEVRGEGVACDALFLCVPHFTVSKFLPESLPVGMLENAWSFGVQFHARSLESIGNVMHRKKGQELPYYSAVMGSPWEIVYNISYSSELGAPPAPSVWSPIPMGNGILATLTVTVSNQYNKGLKYKKRFLDCTPRELLVETLFQIGIRGEGHVEELLIDAAFGSIMYLDAGVPKDVNFLYGPVQQNGMCWASDSTLNIDTPQSPQVSVRGVCTITGEKSDGGCVNCIDTSDIDDIYSYTERVSPVPTGVYLAGEYCAGYYITVPTMEKAAESAKLAACTFFKDAGIKDTVHAMDLTQTVRFEPKKWWDLF